MEAGWQEHVSGSTDDLFREKLGPDIRDDAKRYCPKRSGSLADSIEDHLEGHNLIVSGTGSDERSYCAFVELGHRIVAYGHDTGRVKAPEPFLRPALYQQRGG